MDLEYKMRDSALKSSTGKPQVVRVEFDPPLLGYEEVKPRLLGMKVDADSALGTVRPNPYSIRFASPPLSNLTGLTTHPRPSLTIVYMLYRSNPRKSRISNYRSRSGSQDPSSSS